MMCHELKITTVILHTHVITIPLSNQIAVRVTSSVMVMQLVPVSITLWVVMENGTVPMELMNQLMLVVR